MSEGEYLAFLGKEVRCSECQALLLICNRDGKWVAAEDRKHAEDCQFAARLAEIMLRNKRFLTSLRARP